MIRTYIRKYDIGNTVKILSTWCMRRMEGSTARIHMSAFSRVFMFAYYATDRCKWSQCSETIALFHRERICRGCRWELDSNRQEVVLERCIRAMTSLSQYFGFGTTGSIRLIIQVSARLISQCVPWLHNTSLCARRCGMATWNWKLTLQRVTLSCRFFKKKMFSLFGASLKSHCHDPSAADVVVQFGLFCWEIDHTGAETDGSWDTLQNICLAFTNIFTKASGKSTLRFDLSTPTRTSSWFSSFGFRKPENSSGVFSCLFSGATPRWWFRLQQDIHCLWSF